MDEYEAKEIGIRGEMALEKLEDDMQALKRVVRAAGKLIAIAPENDLYYALNKYCCEHMDEMIEALEALPENLRHE